MHCFIAHYKTYRSFFLTLFLMQCQNLERTAGVHSYAIIMAESNGREAWYAGSSKGNEYLNAAQHLKNNFFIHCIGKYTV